MKINFDKPFWNQLTITFKRHTYKIYFIDFGRWPSIYIIKETSS